MLRYDLTEDAVRERFPNEPAFRTKQLVEGLFGQLKEPHDLSNVPQHVRDVINNEFPRGLTTSQVSVSNDTRTTKYLFTLGDGNAVETVAMEYPNRTTVCVSTQAGCAMNCSFCATGQMGFARHLTAGEIVEQIIVAAQQSAPRRVSNVVFMGMGEPLANYDHVTNALRTVHSLVGISARHMTVSTVGLVPEIEKFGTFELPVTLAVSLHAANNDLRTSIVPINKRYPLERLSEAIQHYQSNQNRRVSFEWAMIDSINDSINDADELAQYARNLGAHINLIPLNRTPGYTYQGSTTETIERFVERLRWRGANVTVRRNRGNEIDAACGQLAQRDGETTSVQIAESSTTSAKSLPN